MASNPVNFRTGAGTQSLPPAADVKVSLRPKPGSITGMGHAALSNAAPKAEFAAAAPSTVAAAPRKPIGIALRGRLNQASQATKPALKYVYSAATLQVATALCDRGVAALLSYK
jgi:hypothetical protein